LSQSYRKHKCLGGSWCFFLREISNIPASGRYLGGTSSGRRDYLSIALRPFIWLDWKAHRGGTKTLWNVKCTYITVLLERSESRCIIFLSKTWHFQVHVHLQFHTILSLRQYCGFMLCMTLICEINDWTNNLNRTPFIISACEVLYTSGIGYTDARGQYISLRNILNFKRRQILDIFLENLTRIDNVNFNLAF